MEDIMDGHSRPLPVNSAKIYDTIVVGAGHAGTEAALASARLGCDTVLVTLQTELMGCLSCNPAIGGIGKAQLVKEVDALGGEMAKAADTCAIQLRMLNASKGCAVHSSRAQIDRKQYAAYIQNVIKKQKNLSVYPAQVTGLKVCRGIVEGVETASGPGFLARTVILTPGTFLNGLIHVGMSSFPGGRIEEKCSGAQLSAALKTLGFSILRFKTGTCARLDGRTIDFSQMQVQNGDEPPAPFSFSTKRLNIKQVPCFITYTNEKTHEIIRRNLDRSPLFSGKIIGQGVRYCPSFEDKVIKFPHHLRHQVFLEPEGLDTDEYYPNGLSTSFPEDVQQEFIHSIPGLEKAKINRFGYGIEHDVVEATQLYPSLETKLVKNLFLAGQINGTTGYEEAAAQGLVAGINAALKVRAQEPFILDRSSSYIGVLIDDLVTKGTPEPYRMFTSRVEYRLILRQDNADLRLRKFGHELGLVSAADYRLTQKKQEQIQSGIALLKTIRISLPGLAKKNSKKTAPPENQKIDLYQLLKRPQTRPEDIIDKLPVAFSGDVLAGIAAEVKYAGFIRRQLSEVRSFKHLERIKIPADIDYQQINGLSREIKEKLTHFKPLNLGQANRISGVTPSAIMILMVYIKKRPQRARV